MTPSTMSRQATVLVVAPWLLTLALFAAIASIAIVASASPSFGMDVSTAGFLLLVGFWALVQSTVGTAIAWRRPENPIGRLMQLTGPLIVSVLGGFLVGALRFLAYGSGDTLGGVAAWLASTAIYPMVFLTLPVLGILFPDGRLPATGFRWPMVAVTSVLGAATVVLALAKGRINQGLPDNPFGVLDLPAEAGGILSAMGSLSLVTALALAVVGVVVRWRRGTVLERAQLKWLLAALTVGVVSFGPSFGSSDSDAFDLVSVLSGLLLPVAIGVAVLRYRLYEIDRIISRTVSWALVTGLLVAVFAAVVVALQGLLAGVTQGQTLAVAASTLVAFALFQPLRRRVQSAVDRRFDRARYDAQRTVDAFAEHLRNEVDLARIRTAVVASASDAVRPVHATVWLRAGPEAGR
jgi:hypothetical protein